MQQIVIDWTAKAFTDSVAPLAGWGSVSKAFVGMTVSNTLVLVDDPSSKVIVIVAVIYVKPDGADDDASGRVPVESGEKSKG